MNKAQMFGLALLLIGLLLILLYAVFSSFNFVIAFFTSAKIPLLIKTAAVVSIIGLIVLMLALTFEKKEVEK
jgi:hypothetical protein